MTTSPSSAIIESANSIARGSAAYPSDITADATVNTDSDSIGTANQSMDVGETIRIDFVSDLTTGGGTPSGFSYSGHVSSNSFIEAIPQVQGNQAETVAFTVWALDSTNTFPACATSSTDCRNPKGGNASPSPR